VKFHIRNFGCRATQADGAALASALAASGHAVAGGCAEAELVILNTCTVTASADQDVRQAVRRVRRENPAARILITGCYAQRAPAEAAALDGVRWVVGNTHKAMIPEIVRAESGSIFVGDILAQIEFMPAPALEAGEDRTRPNLKIQDGCNNRCSFCVIPSVRGRSRSAPPDRVVEQVRDLASRYCEVVLSGVNLGRWGREPAIGMRLVGLLRRLLDETGVERLRLSSVEPMDLSGELLELMATSPRIAQHVHAPLQSGSDAVLRRMRRWYRARHYADRILKTREWMPEAAIGADVMVGFPGETEAEFEATRAFIDGLPFTYLHVFTYSARPGTPAAAMSGQVPVRERKRRNRVLRELASAKNLSFRRGMIGKRLSAVTIEDGGVALSSNYIKIELVAPAEANRLIEVEVSGLGEGLGEVCGDVVGGFDAHGEAHQVLGDAEALA
jgi:threonylcarbamoyladenosine tRNA methylthiotransferase MtaB